MILAVDRTNVNEILIEIVKVIDQYAGKYKICQKSETSLGNLLITQ